MKRVTYKLSIDLKRNNSGSKVMLGAFKGENSARRIEVTLKEDGKPFLIKDSVQAIIYVKKPGINTPSVNGATITNNVITYDILGSDVDTVGIVNFQLKLVDVENDAPVVLITTTFEAEVEEALVNDSGIPSQPTYTVLDTALAKVSEAQRAFEDEIPKVEIALETVQDLVDRETETLNKAETYSNQAKESAAQAKTSETSAEASVSTVSQAEKRVETLEKSATDSKNIAVTSADLASKSEARTEALSRNAVFAENNARKSAEEAKASEADAKKYRDEAEDIIGSGVARVGKIGLVKPDGRTTYISDDGSLSAVAGAGDGIVYLTQEEYLAKGDDVLTDGITYGLIDVNGEGGSGDGITYLTQAEYNAKGPSVNTDNITYGITDADPEDIGIAVERYFEIHKDELIADIIASLPTAESEEF